MAYDNKKNNGKSDAPNANTKGRQYYNEEGFDPSTLVVDLWNRYCSIKIHPALPPNKRTESSKYDYEKFMNVLLTKDLIHNLLYLYDSRFVPAQADNPNTVKEVGIPIPNKDLYIGIGNGLKYGSKIMPYVVIRQIDENGKSVNEIAYEFNTSKGIINYDGMTAKYDPVVINTELEGFICDLREFEKAFSMAYAHSVAESQKYIMRKRIEVDQAVLGALGVKTDDSGNSGGGGRKSGNGFFDGKNNDNVDHSAEQITANDVDGIEAELSSLN